MLDAKCDQQPVCNTQWSCWGWSTASRWIQWNTSLPFLFVRVVCLGIFCQINTQCLLLWLYPSLRPTNYSSYSNDSFPFWVKITACNFPPMLNSITPCACMVFGNYCLAWKLWLSLQSGGCSLIHTPHFQGLNFSRGKINCFISSCHLSAQNWGFNFHHHRVLFFFFSYLGGHMLTDPLI